MIRQRALAATLTVLAIGATACSGSDASEVSVDVPPVVTEAGSDPTTPPTEVATTTATTEPTTATTADSSTDTEPSTPSSTPEVDEMAVVADAAFPDARCEANRQAGTISYLSGFDFAATASIIDVLVADHNGYYDDLCLDVDIAPSFSVANYPLVAAGDAQFSSAGSFSELATFAAENDAALIALAVEGRVAIDSLMVKPEYDDLDSLAGTTIGIKGKLPPSIAAMLAQFDLVENSTFDTLLLEGFDPVAQWAVPGVSAIPGYKSNEPGTLERAGIEFDLYDPTDYGVPGSFGVLYTNGDFLAAHPTATEDFMRATMKGLADAIDDPEAAAAIAVDLINGNGNPNFLSPEGETFRWTTDADLVTYTTPAESFPGVPDPETLAIEIAAYDEVGVYGDAGAPSVDDHVDPDLLRALYADDGSVIWPS